MTPDARRQRIEQFERTCRKRGLPLTTQRRTIFEMILDREDHPTADQVYEQARRRIHSISRTTVYRILDTFIELGLITKVCHPGSAARFDPKTERHHHLICLRCEGVIDLEGVALNAVAWPDVRRYGFEIRDYHIHFRGICSRCRRAAAANQRAAQSRRRPRLRTPARRHAKPVPGARRTRS